MKDLSIDIETYSDIDITKAGLYRYVESPVFEILLFAYSVDFGAVQVVDLTARETVPDEICQALDNPNIVKHAYNAVFEITCLNTAGFCATSFEQWRCTMLHGLYLGYPAGLALLGEALGLPAEKRKLTVGKSLIKYFCCPCVPTKRNGGRSRNLPMHDTAKWELFKEYCRMDVVTEMEDYKKMERFPVPRTVHKEWCLDLEINKRGVAVDTALVRGALTIDGEQKAELTQKAANITGLDNPNSRQQLLDWLNSNTELVLGDLTKATVAEHTNTKDAVAAEILSIRTELAKSSVSKYKAMETARCADGRVHGMLQFYGANRTGRWAGRLVQLHNLPRNYIASLDTARELIKSHNRIGLSLLYGDVSDTLSQLIRTAFIAPEGKVLCVADFSAIEARVLSWLADEKWRMDVFDKNGDIYCASASSMFGVPVEKHGVNGHLRQKGKIAELALGYGGGPSALIAMGALKMGLTEAELPDIVSRWRKANARIKDFWYKVSEAALSVMHTANPVGVSRGIIFARECDAANGLDFLTVQLPSGRKLYYPGPYLSDNQFGNKALHYRCAVTGKWAAAGTYGGKLAENITQAIARDCLAVALARLAKNGYEILMHIHDEVVCEVSKEKLRPNEDEIMSRLMSEPIEWAPELKLNAEGFVSEYYKKD